MIGRIKERRQLDDLMLTSDSELMLDKLSIVNDEFLEK